MKKNLFKAFVALGAFVMISTSISAQGAYATVNLGYGFNAASETQENFTMNESSSSYSYSLEAVNSSLGKGLNFGGAFGYMFNKNIGAELGVNYLLGGKTELSGSQTYDSNGSFITNNITYTGSANMFRFTPTIVLATGMEKFNPYAKFGAVIGSGTTHIEIERTSESYSGVGIEKLENTGGLAFGYTASIGANYSLNEKLSLFGEINLISMSYAPTEGEITESSFDGQSNLSELSTRERYIEYVDKVTYDGSYDENKPKQELATKTAFSSIGLSFGLKYTF